MHSISETTFALYSYLLTCVSILSMFLFQSPPTFIVQLSCNLYKQHHQLVIVIKMPRMRRILKIYYYIFQKDIVTTCNIQFQTENLPQQQVVIFVVAKARVCDIYTMYKYIYDA